MRVMHTMICAALLVLAAFSGAAASPRQDIMEGPLTGEVLQVLDGDTVSVKIRVWIGQEVETSLRINGIDAPEIKGKCERERSIAETARVELEKLIGSGTVRIYNVRLEKYAGRVLADVETARGVKVGQHMLDKGLVRPYHGEKRQPWCSVAEIH